MIGNRTSKWVEAAAGLPIAFAQVREDPLLDIAALQRISGTPRIAMVASGGCTAAALAAFGGIRSIHLVDPNPAQLALSRLKLLLLAEADPRTRRALLGHEVLDPADRRSHVCALLRRLNLADESLGPIGQVAREGPDFLGRYERLFAALQEAMQRQRHELESLLSSARLSSECEQLAPSTTLGKALDEAMDEVLSLPNLVRLFGQEATRNPVLPFSRFFAGRVRAALTTSSPAENPWLWQMLLGRFPPGSAYPWFDATAPSTFPAVTWECAFMCPVLESRPEAFDFVHLSNILDWLSAEDAAVTLSAAFNALRPGGCVLLRQLNSTLDVISVGRQFRWDIEGANDLHRNDRSFFYRAIHLGFKQ